jgi:putative ABC transport system permease protein
MRNDLWNAMRSLLRTRRVTTLAVIATIGIVLGGVTMVFGLVNAVLLRPLPYPDADRLVTVRLNDRAGGLRLFMPFPLFEQLSSRVRSAEQMAAFRFEALDVQGDQWQVVQAAVATVNVFEVLGARPVLGRHFVPEDDRAEGDEPVVLSEALWRRAFAADPSIVGRRLRLSHLVSTQTSYCVVVGVTPAVLASGPHEFVDLYVPERREAACRTHWAGADHCVIARLRAGTTLDEVQHEVAEIARQSARFTPGLDVDGATIEPLANELGLTWRERLVSLFSVAALALVIACANIAGLLLGVSRSRSAELGTRLALGATHWRVARQLLLESLLTACAGGAAALVVATAGLPVFVALAPRNIPRLATVSIDMRTIGFTVIAAIVCGALFGLAPAVAQLRQGWNRFGDVAHTARRVPLRWGAEGLVALQLALATALTAGSMLVLGSEWRLMRAPLGFDTENVLTARLDIGARYKDSDPADAFKTRLLAAGTGMRSITALGVSNQLPPNVSSTNTLFLPDGRKIGQLVLDVSPGYFDVLRIAVVAGAVPGPGEPLARTAVVNEAFAMRWFGRRNVVGETIEFGADQMRIAAVTGNAREAAVRTPAKPILYVLWGPGVERPRIRMFVLARARSRSNSAMVELEYKLRDIAPDVPVTLGWLDTRFAQDRAETTFYARVLLFFAAVTVLVGAVGVAAIAREAVASRRREAAIRLALGATTAGVRRRLLLGTSVACWVGVFAGLWLAGVTGSLLRTALYDISPRDPLTLTSAALVSLAVALGAAYVPARAVSDGDVVTLLRAE